ncbi:hypothetical protein V6N12_051829 [Hibiscus sabdariffa]|uniref:Uncharacterized protein n=1 Tax=Hibiscus sabdariffa TaxID=183260 RepID=A0ABR2GGG4_9ROSI
MALSSLSKETPVLQIGHAAILINHESKHLLWNKWPHPTRFLHHCPCLKPSKQITQESGSKWVDFGSGENLNWGSFLSCSGDNPDE